MACILFSEFFFTFIFLIPINANLFSGFGADLTTLLNMESTLFLTHLRLVDCKACRYIQLNLTAIYPGHVTDENCNPDGQRHLVSTGLARLVGGGENREHENERQDELHPKRLAETEGCRGGGHAQCPPHLWGCHHIQDGRSCDCYGNEVC